MKKTDYLITLGDLWVKKYASVDANSIKPEIETHIWQAIKNAASQGNNAKMLNFPVMIQNDQATLKFDIVRDDTLGYKSIKVLNFSVTSQDPAKYVVLPKQIEEYLNKNWELFPTMHNGQAIDYDQFALNLTYQSQQGELIAGG